MRINVHAGHNNYVPGAGTEFSETAQNRVVTKKVISLLKAEGHTVYDCTDDTGKTVNQNLANIVAKCNAHAVDLDVSIHFNAFDQKARGTEVWVHTGSTVRKTAQRIVDRIAEIGFANRGVKETTALYVIRKTNAPALLVECCFCDCRADAKLYNPDEMAYAIAEAINGNSLKSPPPELQVRAIVAGRNRKVPVRAKPDKTSAVIDHMLTDEVFTVVGVSKGGNWYHRKAGGWVAANNVRRTML